MEIDAGGGGATGAHVAAVEGVPACRCRGNVGVEGLDAGDDGFVGQGEGEDSEGSAHAAAHPGLNGPARSLMELCASKKTNE